MKKRKVSSGDSIKAKESATKSAEIMRHEGDESPAECRQRAEMRV